MNGHREQERKVAILWIIHRELLLVVCAAILKAIDPTLCESYRAVLQASILVSNLSQRRVELLILLVIVSCECRSIQPIVVPSNSAFLTSAILLYLVLRSH